MGFTSNDAAHLFFGLPVMVYGHLIALDAYNGFGKGKRIPKWAEGSFLIGFGTIIFVGDIFGYRGCFAHGPAGHTCIDINIMHMLFGIFMMAIGALSLMHTYMSTFEKASMWMTPVCLVVIGVFMVSHQQEDEYGVFVHTSFGVSAQAAAILRGLTIIDPKRWAIFTAYASSVTAMCFIAGSDSMDALLDKQYRLMGHTAVLGVCTLAAVMLIPFMLFIAWMNKGVPQHDKFVEQDMYENEMPLIGGKY
eukprot:Phypoly_transcript_16916.p1 GENE.Phypoly_transcript_16916~~Phypoly_transcript_16916.p1  ORF type:complete len:249 (+),score=32.18 Phypoly_transcript_16916:41-787(+)